MQGQAAKKEMENGLLTSLLRELQENPQRISHGTIIEITRRLGWSLSNIQMDEREDESLLMRLSASPKQRLIIEYTGGNPEEAARSLHQKQIRAECPLICITQGKEWHLYLNEAETIAEPFLRLDIKQSGAKLASRELNRYLGRESFTSGKATSEALNLTRQSRREKAIRKGMQNAFLELIESQEPELCKIISQRSRKHLGRAPEHREVVEVLETAASRFRGFKETAKDAPEQPEQSQNQKERGPHKVVRIAEGVSGIRKGRKSKDEISGFVYGDNDIVEIRQWNQLLPGLFELLYDKDPQMARKGAAKLKWMQRETPAYKDAPLWKRAGKTGWWVRTYIPKNDRTKKAKKMIRVCGGDPEQFQLVQ